MADIPQIVHRSDPKITAGTGVQQGLTNVTDGMPHADGMDA